MPQEGFKRKPTAILSADVEGYSRLMGEDEEATIRTLTSYRNAIAKLVQQYRGRVVDSPGDNILSEFSSVVDAVNCAVEIQRELAERNAGLPDNRKMEFRIGVNVGDVVQEEERIYGDGVNIAARVESMSQAGGICISGRAYDQVSNKLGLEYENLGEHQVKNISTPIRVYRVLSIPGAADHRVVQAKEAVGKKWRKLVMAAAVVLVVVVVGAIIWNRYLRYPSVEKASVEKMAFALPEKPSIAVLPFANMSDDPGKEYLSDGITEQIITTLSKAPRVFVISRTSTFSYKGKSVKVQQVAEELGVRYVLEGSVQQSGDKIRITAQLIDALTGRHLWAQRYERDYKDIFALQDEITFEILKEIGVKLVEGEKIRSGKKFTNLDALEKRMEALTYLRAFNIESNAIARRLAEETIALDPEHPAGYALLAWINIMDVWFGSSKSPRKSIAQATELGQKAIDLDENSDSAYSLLGYIYGMQRQYDKAVEAGQKAIELSPNSDEPYVGLAMTLNWMGKPEAAIELYKKAKRLCPFPPSLYYLNLGSAYGSVGRCEEAIAEYKKSLHLTPQNILAFMGSTICYGQLGLEEESRAAAAEVVKLNPNFNIRMYMMMFSMYKNQELVKKGADALRKAGIPEG
jgi:adenylate cyclase